jgi:predicted aspartyl protease
MNKRLTLAYNYTGLARHIKTPVELFTGVYDERNSHVLNATWDTGATCSVIVPEIAQELSLKPIDTVSMFAVNSTHTANVSVASLRFPNGIILKDVRVRICPITPTTQMLLGMDVIAQLDLAISNGNNQTLFSFAIPPFTNKVDLSKWHD